ncbi:hypothetical protein X777_15665 [Ooceraea biroi]|uniref:Uncharacterized protein n=1 Tax=Ooceraea biroi TaxID=2015173 RepID=A0A026WVE8_OOCBI|nr:hypothetical protein X777_15665 [Ooceraea biroi]
MSNIPIIFFRSANSTPAGTSEARDTAASQSRRRRRCVRILGRRYALTTTEHKYLEVGINVGHGPSYMERSHNIGPLTVDFIKFNDTKCVRFEVTNVRSIMMEATLTTMFNLDKCIDYMYNWLVNCIDHVDSKYEQFCKIARSINNPNDITVAIQNSEYFDDKELIDWFDLTRGQDRIERFWRMIKTRNIAHDVSIVTKTFRYLVSQLKTRVFKNELPIRIDKFILRHLKYLDGRLRLTVSASNAEIIENKNISSSQESAKCSKDSQDDVQFSLNEIEN